MTLEFLSPVAGGPAALSPMWRDARAAGARFEERDGWRVATGYADPAAERAAIAERAGWADLSHLGKLEVQGPPEALAEAAGAPLGSGRAAHSGGAWWCPMTSSRAVVLCPTGAAAGLLARLEPVAAVVDVTTTFAALAVVGPAAREVLARLTALDLRPRVAPVGSFLPGSVARVPGMVLREGEDRFLVLFGAALGHYMWTAVADAARHLGGGPVGLDVLEAAAGA